MSAPKADTRPAPPKGALAGVLAAALAVAVTEFAGALLPGGHSLFVAVGDAVIELTPGPVVEFAIATFGTANRFVLLLSMSLVGTAAGALIGVGAARRWWIGPTGLSAFALVGLWAGIADPLVPLLTALVAPLVGAAVGAAALWWMSGAPSRTVRTPPTIDYVGDRARRAFLGRALTVAAGAVVFGVGGQFFEGQAATEARRVATRLPVPDRPLPPPPAAASLDVPGITPLVTANDRFFRIDTALRVPRIDPQTHAVRFTGMVDQPFEISYDELLERAGTEADVTLACVSNEVGGDLVGNARWLGVPLADLLEQARVQPGATQIVGRAVDGWTAGFPVESAFDSRPALVAVGMNGEPLPPQHGFPARLVIAGLYGYVSATKWLAEVELTTFEAYDAYWIPRGWSELGPIKTQSRIDVPRARATVDAGVVAVAGVAWGGERGITAVEVAIDDDWQAAELAAELAPTSWRQWRLRWQAEPGEHVLRVRATDGDGHTQVAEVSPPAPDGATGYHTIRVLVA